MWHVKDLMPLTTLHTDVAGEPTSHTSLRGIVVRVEHAVDTLRQER